MANPTPDTTSMVTPGALGRDENGIAVGWNKKYISTATTTLVKTGSGFLHSITFNKPVATGTVELDDAVTNTNPFAIVTTPTSPMPVTLVYDVAFANGLSITTAVAAQDITVSYI